MTNLVSQLFGKDFERFFIGYDEQIKNLAKLHDDLTKNIPSYPPFNVKKIDDNRYSIELAVAGFSQQDIDIEMNDGKLVIRGNMSSADDTDVSNFLFQGIANRAFTRTFALNDEIEVKDAEIFNGMLKIALERFIPEHKKPKKVTVKSRGEKQLLTEEK